MDTIGIKNYNYTQQIAANVNTTSAHEVQALDLNTSVNSSSGVSGISDKIDVNPIFIITPDGTTHRKTTNELGETEYIPSITLSSFQRQRLVNA